ncbi:hypothetical protein A8F94_00400 [Bacillus sp. FJAT-27225]|uniref:hypothetical protein n=1 Tax=Bacillus sp. FJAT-27225 TaxID=1743144 RepID=UPI00080C2BF1|nr:hypothetical protein [Bacillus sp. FJAT-27225]OCA90393.1 hypothetical protein A8F94_00400 [Bacillus sp. FJAT-27225]
MFTEEYEHLLKRSVEVAPDWLREDVENIVSKEPTAGISYLIAELHHTYTFSIRHILSARHLSSEWAQISRERLNVIDNNIDIIVALYEEVKAKLKNA